MTAIYSVLAGEASAWHFCAGAPLVPTPSPDGHESQAIWLGPDVAAGQ